LDPLFVLPAGGFFSAYLDRWRSSASAAPPAGALYRANTEGRILPIAETLYLTVSDDPLAPLPAQQEPAAPGLPDLSRRLVLDLWSAQPCPADAERFALLRRYGLRDLSVLYRNWQQFGYKRRSPVHYPANPERGTNGEFRDLVAGAVDHGWLFALREE